MGAGRYRGAVAVLALGMTTALAGCGSGGGGTADGRSVGACFDGRCEILVTKPTRIPVDSRFGVGALHITSISARSVVVRASGSGISLATSVGEGGTGTLNGLSFRVKEVSGTQAVLDFFPQK